VDAQASADSPFYVAHHHQQEAHATGIKPLGAAGTSPGGPVYELPAPVDWTTTDFSGEWATHSKTAQFSANVIVQQVRGPQRIPHLAQPVRSEGANLESSTLSTDNNLWRLGLNAMWKQLPMTRPSPCARRTRSSPARFLCSTSFLSISGTAGANRLSGASSSVFDGEVENKYFSASFTSHPAKTHRHAPLLQLVRAREQLDSPGVHAERTGLGRQLVDLTAAGTALTTCIAGAPALHPHTTWAPRCSTRWNKHNKLSFDLDYLDIERERIDFDRSKETKAYDRWEENSSSDLVDIRVKYQHLNRKSEFLLSDSDRAVFDKYLYRFDARAAGPRRVQGGARLHPVQFWTSGREVNYMRNK
jgi:hypothetical protein